MNLPDKFLFSRYFLPACLLLIPAFAIAKISDATQVLNIEADSVEIREQQGISIYKGNVTISRGSMLIKGQLIHITSKKNNEFDIKIEGEPARFKQLNDSDQEVNAESEKMNFSSESGILTMNKKAILVQGENRFTSEHIIYNTKKDIVQAGKAEAASSTTKPERVSITIQPKQKQKTTADQPQ